MLLEWARTGEFERWSWDRTLAALPRLISDGVRDELRLPLAAGFSFVSPDVRAPSRYFDSVVMRYRTPLDGLSARVSWIYEEGGEFSNELSAVTRLPKAETSGSIVVRLSDNPKWDRSKTVQRIRVTIESADRHRGNRHARHAARVGPARHQPDRVRSRCVFEHVRTAVVFGLRSSVFRSSPRTDNRQLTTDN